MKDIYINAPTISDLLSDLATVDLSDGESILVVDAETCVVYLGDVVDQPAQYDSNGIETSPIKFLPGVHAAIRFRTDSAWEAFSSKSFLNGTHIIEKTPNMPVWA